MNTLKLGWTGLGNMGNPMVMNLLKAGFSIGFQSKKRERSAITAGAKSASSLQELMKPVTLF
jgi:3-hydroxyisobutyrate dehydrogenase